MLTQRTFRLKRNRPKEPLGLVLLSGDKVSWEISLLSGLGLGKFFYSDYRRETQELFGEKGEPRHPRLESWNIGRRQNHKGRTLAAGCEPKALLQLVSSPISCWFAADN